MTLSISGGAQRRPLMLLSGRALTQVEKIHDLGIT